MLDFSQVDLSPVIAIVRRWKMERVQINRVAILDDGSLGVFPETSSPMCQYIYREAAGVNWNSPLRCFQSTPPREWSHKEWYGHIVSVVLSGLDIRLALSPHAVFVPGDPHFITDIHEADVEVQRWIDVERPKIMKGEQQRGELRGRRRARLPP
jgi:hypothetical protein